MKRFLPKLIGWSIVASTTAAFVLGVLSQTNLTLKDYLRTYPAVWGLIASAVVALAIIVSFEAHRQCGGPTIVGQLVRKGEENFFFVCITDREKRDRILKVRVLYYSADPKEAITSGHDVVLMWDSRTGQKAGYRLFLAPVSKKEED